MLISPEHFLNELLGYQKTAALKAAIELDLFSALAVRGATWGKSERTGASEKRDPHPLRLSDHQRLP